MTRAFLDWLDVVRLLLATASRRSRARTREQAIRTRAGSPRVVIVLAFFGCLAFHVLLGLIAVKLARVADEIELERDGRRVVAAETLREVRRSAADESHLERLRAVDPSARDAEELRLAELAVGNSRAAVAEAMRIEAGEYKWSRGADRAAAKTQLEQHAQAQGEAGFVARPEGSARERAAAGSRVLALFLLVWWISLVFQGDGSAMDTTRRRHPMWEWYLGFPVSPSAVFVAEALAPAFANPMLLTAPALFAAIVAYDAGIATGLLALPIGIGVTVAAAVWAKALEVLVMLRSPPRSRGGWFVLLAAVGFIAMFLPMIAIGAPQACHAALVALDPVIGWVPSASPLLDVAAPGGFARATLLGLGVAALLLVPAILTLRFAAARGLEGGFGGDDVVTDTVAFEAPRSGRWAWLGDPLLRKEWLWLKRDRGAIIQLIGIPLVLVGVQAFNVQNMVRNTDFTWHRLAGLVVGLGAYLIYTAGPRALLSEGPALVTTMSWPRSIEDTLRTKVRLLLALVTAMVWSCFAVLMWMFPADALWLLVVAIVWPLFGLSVTEKAITLIQAPSHSGEPEPVPRFQVFAANFGNLTFAIALFTAQWPLAIAAIAMNWVFAGAVWESFRIRLTHLFDPDSMPRLQPPTVLTAVLGVIALMEVGTVLALPFTAIGGEGSFPFGRAMGYGIAALLVVFVIVRWHRQFGVGLRDILRVGGQGSLMPIGASVAGIALGAALAFVAMAYLQFAQHLPWPEITDPIRRTAEFYAKYPSAYVWTALMAVGIAPWAEEFLFRGLLFRAMVPQWGMARALLASTAFFAILHPPIAWPPVFALGALSALLFHRSRALVPCILLHATYNGMLFAGSAWQ